MPDSGGAIGCASQVILSVLTFIGGCFALASFIVAGINGNATCDDSSFIPYGNWLIVNGVLTLGYCGMGLLLLYSLRNHDERLFAKYMLWSSVAIFTFKLVWNIIGAIILFEYDGTCWTETPSLPKMTLALLITQWIIMVFLLIIIFMSCCKKDGLF